MAHSIPVETRLLMCLVLMLWSAACTTSPRVEPAEPESTGSQAGAMVQQASGMGGATPSGPEAGSGAAPESSAPADQAMMAPARSDGPMQPSAESSSQPSAAGASAPESLQPPAAGSSGDSAPMQPPPAADPSSPPAGSPAPANTVSWPADCEEHHVLRAHGSPGTTDPSKFSVKKAEQVTATFYYKAPWTGDKQLLKTHFELDNTKVVHHWALWATVMGSAADGSIDAAEESTALGGEQFVAGGGAGGNDVDLPPNVGLRLPSGGSLLFELEVHYFNAVSENDELDGSSIELCVTSKKRPIEAAIHTMGLGTFTLPAHKTTDLTHNCVPAGLDTEVHLMTVQPHMHRTGRHAKIVLNRKSGEKLMLHDMDYEFLEQRTYPIPEDKSAADVVLQPGDSITTTFTYENATDSTISEGIHSQDEMFNLGILAWPAGKLHNSIGAIGELVPGFGGLADVSCIDP